MGVWVNEGCMSEPTLASTVLRASGRQADKDKLHQECVYPLSARLAPAASHTTRPYAIPVPPYALPVPPHAIPVPSYAIPVPQSAIPVPPYALTFPPASPFPLE
eukprot:2533668-Rhodomonas_salina.3